MQENFPCGFLRMVSRSPAAALSCRYLCAGFRMWGCSMKSECTRMFLKASRLLRAAHAVFNFDVLLKFRHEDAAPIHEGYAPRAEEVLEIANHIAFG